MAIPPYTYAGLYSHPSSLSLHLGIFLRTLKLPEGVLSPYRPVDTGTTRTTSPLSTKNSTGRAKSISTRLPGPGVPDCGLSACQRSFQNPASTTPVLLRPLTLSLIHISEPTRLRRISYAV